MCARSKLGESGEETQSECNSLRPTTTAKASNVPEKMREDSKGKQKNEHMDALALTTLYTKIICFKIVELADAFQTTTLYKILTRTTQPAHIFAVLVISTVALLVYPHRPEESANKQSTLVPLAYLTSFAAHFGIQIWMTFVSGLALYFSLPRHTFGLCQEVLFPKYFTLNSFLSTVTLVLFVQSRNGQWDSSGLLQSYALGLCAFIELMVRLYLAPSILHLMHAKNAIESEAGKGTEVGHVDHGGLTKCQHYMTLHKSFRRVHMGAAIGNIVALCCSFIHLHYLATRISI